MIPRILRIVSLATTLIVLLSYGLFVLDQTRSGSKQQIAALNADARGVTQSPPVDAAHNIDQADPGVAVKRMRSQRHSALREKLDEADDFLLKPFAGIARSRSIWAQRTIAALLGLLVFGFGLRLFANFIRVRPST